MQNGARRGEGRASWNLLIYEEYVAVMGSWNGAAVLARMLKLDDVVREMDKQTESLNARAIKEGRFDDVAPLRDGWFWKTEEEFAKETFLTRSTAKRGLEAGVERGFWERRPGERYDGAKRSASWYRVDLLAIDRACKEAGYAGLPGFNSEAKAQVEGHVQNEQGEKMKLSTGHVQNEQGRPTPLVQNEQSDVQNGQGPCPKWTNTVLDLSVSDNSNNHHHARAKHPQEKTNPPTLSAEKEIRAAYQEAAVATDLIDDDFLADKTGVRIPRPIQQMAEVMAPLIGRELNGGELARLTDLNQAPGYSLERFKKAVERAISARSSGTRILHPLSYVLAAHENLADEHKHEPTSPQALPDSVTSWLEGEDPEEKLKKLGWY